MEFLDYKQEVEKIMERKAKHLNKDVKLNMEKMFEAYINDVNPIDFIRSSISLNENSQNNEFSKYYNRIVKNIRTFGYNVIKMPRELMESVVNFYNEGYNSMVPTNYCLEQLKKNTIKVDKKKADNILLKNQLLLLVHNIDNCALKGVEVTKTDAYAILKIKIFEMRNEINTDIKSYIKQLNKYFAPYVRQNIDNGSRIDILGYSVNQRSVYATVKLKIDFIDSDGFKNNQFSAKETVNIIKMYIEIFRTFAEQYQNVV
ncbi:MAG: hypothetical protein J6W64_01645 [Bacilli bacterium]|nr:hypothetical protein [Bacilli bacterium]